MAVICNFTNKYKSDPRFGVGQKILDFTMLSGHDGYCADETAECIKNALSEYAVSETCYLDDGNHHYISALRCQLIDESFELVVFDHHTDMQPPSLLPLLSCGSWIKECLDKLPMLKHVTLIGPPADRIDDIADYKERVTFINQIEADEINNASEESSPVNGNVSCNKNIANSVSRTPCGSSLPVFISVDEDILSPAEFESVWDQGSMSRSTLDKWIEYYKSNRRVLGIDICG